MLSHKEGFSLNIIEAFFMKVPVWRTDCGGYEEQKSGCELIDADDYDMLAKRIEKILDGSLEYTSKVECAYNLAIEEFTVEKMIVKTIDVYNKTIAERRI